MECESCAYFVYDEYDDCYYCDAEIDQDDAERMFAGRPGGSARQGCPYYLLYDEYAIVRKQN